MHFIDDSFVTDERFDAVKFLAFNDNFDVLTSFFLINVPRLPEQGLYTIKNEEKRPDLLSYNLYGDTQYWWLILLYNDILDINNLIVGLQIRYPSISSIENLYLRASTLKKTS